MFLMMGLFVVVFYFLLIRPQQKEAERTPGHAEQTQRRR